jgi:hypothetical protein
MMKKKMVIGQGSSMGIGGCNRLCPVATGQSLVALFSLSASIEDRTLLWMVVRSQIYYLEYILAYGSGKARYSSWVLALFEPTDWRQGKVEV